MEAEIQPIVRQQLLFRVPPTTAFEAFADPAITTRFWFTHSSGRLHDGYSHKSWICRVGNQQD